MKSKSSKRLLRVLLAAVFVLLLVLALWGCKKKKPKNDVPAPTADVEEETWDYVRHS